MQGRQKAVQRKKGRVLAGAGVSKGIEVRAILFGEDRRVHGLEYEPGAMSSRMKFDRRRVNHDESVGAGGDAWAYQAASWRVGNCPITIKVPTLHTGHKATSTPVTSSITSRADFLGVRDGSGSIPRSARHCARSCFLELESQSREVAIRSGIPSLPTCSNRAMTFERGRSCSAIRTSTPR